MRNQNYSSYQYRKKRSPRLGGGETDFLWLVSLSDLMILLFIFFAALFSFSAKNMGPETLANIQKIFQDQTQLTNIPNLDEIQSRLLKWTLDRNFAQNLKLEKKQDALIVQINEDALFRSGESSLQEASSQWVQSVGDFLKQIPAPYRIGIEGHTDDRPIKANEQALDNWDLSARRAHAVLMALKLSPEQLKRTVLMGYGDTKPLVPNTNDKGDTIPENQARNRRVSIRIF